MASRSEPGDDIQVFLKGTGRCLWGFIQPVPTRDGDIVLKLSVAPKPDTSEIAYEAGVRNWQDGDRRHFYEDDLVLIPALAVDVIFGDERHDNEEVL